MYYLFNLMTGKFLKWSGHTSYVVALLLSLTKQLIWVSNLETQLDKWYML
jgi:hypothetical protein